MTNNNSFSEDNPFELIKVRQILWCFILVTLGIGFQIAIINLFSSSKRLVEDPILIQFLLIIILILTSTWLWRRLNIVGIKIKYIIGKIPTNYEWISFVALVIARVFFSKGIFRILYHPLYLVFPSLVENFLREPAKDNIYLANLTTNLKVIYYLLKFSLSYLVIPTFFLFIVYGITLHRWAAKWGTKKAILAICLILSVFSYQNIIGNASYFLVYLLLYIKTRTLIIPIVASLLETTIFSSLNLLTTFLNSGRSTTIIEIARSEFWLGVLYFAFSAPLVIYFVYNNWPNRNTQLPYFANKHKTELIRADS